MTTKHARLFRSGDVGKKVKMMREKSNAMRGFCLGSDIISGSWDAASGQEARVIDFSSYEFYLQVRRGGTSLCIYLPIYFLIVVVDLARRRPT